MAEVWKIRCLYGAFAISLAIGIVLSLAAFPVVTQWPPARAATAETEGEHAADVLPTIETVAELDRLLSREHTAIYIDVCWSIQAVLGRQVIERAVRLARGRPTTAHLAADVFCVDGTRIHDAPLYKSLTQRGVDPGHFSAGAGTLLSFHRGELVEVIDCVGSLTAEDLIDHCRRVFERRLKMLNRRLLWLRFINNPSARHRQHHPGVGDSV